MLLYDIIYSRGSMDSNCPLPGKAKGGTLAKCTNGEAKHLVMYRGKWQEISVEDFDAKLNAKLHA